jgi:hypothetical protein
MSLNKARALPTSTGMCSDFETKEEIPTESASSAENASLYSLNMMIGTRRYQACCI